MKKIITLLITLCLSLPIISYGADNSSSSSSADSQALQDIDTNTATSASLLSKLLSTLSMSLFSKLPDLGSTMASLVAMPSANDSAYDDQVDMMNTLQKYYQGDKDGSTLSNNYSDIYHDYLLGNDDSATDFPDEYVSANSLYLDSNTPFYYTKDQKSAAQAYVAILSGIGTSDLRKPDSSWLKVSSASKTYQQKQNIRKYVTMYDQLVATQSIIDYNLSYVYSRNLGYDMDGQLENYTDSKISAAGLVQYTLQNKLYNPDWHANLGAMSISAVLKEIAELIGACFLELVDIDNVQQKQLVTQSAELSLNLANANQMISAQQQQIEDQ